MKRRKIKEFIEKAREAGSAEELLSLARENNIEMTEDPMYGCCISCAHLKWKGTDFSNRVWVCTLLE